MTSGLDMLFHVESHSSHICYMCHMECPSLLLLTITGRADVGHALVPCIRYIKLLSHLLLPAELYGCLLMDPMRRPKVQMPSCRMTRRVFGLSNATLLRHLIPVVHFSIVNLQLPVFQCLLGVEYVPNNPLIYHYRGFISPV